MTSSGKKPKREQSKTRPKAKTKRTPAKPKAKSDGSKDFLLELGAFFSRNRMTISAIAIVLLVFAVASIIKNMNDSEKLVYSGPQEEVEESSYPLSELHYSYYYQDEYNFKSYDDGTITSRRGIDVSEHQGEIDWSLVKESGVEFAFIRAGYRTYDQGNLKEDAYFRYNIDNAIANGIDVGVYFFSQAITVDESIEEAKYVTELVEGYDLALPIAHDMEEVTGSDDRINNLTTDERTEIADAFCEVVENYGYDSIIYANPSWILSHLNIFKLSNRKIWLAHYAESTPYPFRYEFWQYSDSGIVDGINEPVDLNIMYIRP